jgi:Lipoate-protein ligase B
VDDKGRRKICAIGVHMSRWVSMHGFALNVHTGLDYFDQIIPCGIREEDTSVTSISAEIGQLTDISDVRSIVKEEFKNVFGSHYI